MKPSRFPHAVLLASVAALVFTATPEPAQAHCPPGLAKKGSCVPPGHRKHWKAGEYFPTDIRYRRINYYDYGLPKPGDGRYYVAVDEDVYLISEATRLIVRAILSGN